MRAGSSFAGGAVMQHPYTSACKIPAPAVQGITRKQCPDITKYPLLSKITRFEGFPGAPVVRNPPCHAGGHGFGPWSWKIPHATGQLNLPTAMLKPACPTARAPQREKPWQQEAPAPQLESSSHSPQLEKARAQWWPGTAKISQN